MWWNDGWSDGHMWGGYGGWWGMGLMALFGAALFVALVWGVVRMTRSEGTTTVLDSPRAILDRRLAAGEISSEQYAEARRLIENRATPDVPAQP